MDGTNDQPVPHGTANDVAKAMPETNRGGKPHTVARVPATSPSTDRHEVQHNGPYLRDQHESRPRLGRMVKAAVYFLSRKQARRAWLIFAASIAVASIPWTTHVSLLRQGAIVMAGIAATAVFMPELSSQLWNLGGDEIRDMIPENRRRAFHAQLVKADCPNEDWGRRWADLVWTQGVVPLLDAAHETSRIHWDVTYEVAVHLGLRLNIGGRTQTMARVETRHSYECLLPALATDNLWVSVVGNAVSLHAEFDEVGCLSRELVRLPGLEKQAWADEVRRQCNIRVKIGQYIVDFAEDNVVTLLGDDNTWIVRWMLPKMSSDLVNVPVTFDIDIDFPTKVRENNFPLLLAGYYCAGRTSLAFRFYHNQIQKPRLRYFSEFLSEGGTNVAAWKPEWLDTRDRQTVVYRTPPDSLLWPGSGIYCWWESE
jgi:hypothetical protein